MGEGQGEAGEVEIGVLRRFTRCGRLHRRCSGARTPYSFEDAYRSAESAAPPKIRVSPQRLTPDLFAAIYGMPEGIP